MKNTLNFYHTQSILDGNTPAMPMTTTVATHKSCGFFCASKLPALWSIPRVATDSPRPDRRLFVVLLMLAFMMRHTSLDSHWKQRLVGLLVQYPNLPLASMGFAGAWQEHPVWQGIED